MPTSRQGFFLPIAPDAIYNVTILNEFYPALKKDHRSFVHITVLSPEWFI